METFISWLHNGALKDDDDGHPADYKNARYLQGNYISPEVEPKVFDRAVLWLYTGTLGRETLSSRPRNLRQLQQDYMALWAVAHTHNILALERAIIHALHESFDFGIDVELEDLLQLKDVRSTSDLHRFIFFADALSNLGNLHRAFDSTASATLVDDMRKVDAKRALEGGLVREWYEVVDACQFRPGKACDDYEGEGPASECGSELEDGSDFSSDRCAGYTLQKARKWVYCHNVCPAYTASCTKKSSAQRVPILVP